MSTRERYSPAKKCPLAKRRRKDSKIPMRFQINPSGGAANKWAHLVLSKSSVENALNGRKFQLGRFGQGQVVKLGSHDISDL